MCYKNNSTSNVHLMTAFGCSAVQCSAGKALRRSVAKLCNAALCKCSVAKLLQCRQPDRKPLVPAVPAALLEERQQAGLSSQMV